MVYESMNIRTRLIFKDFIAKYINQILQSDYARKYLMTNSKQAIGQASINQTIICNLLIPLPHFEEQKAIVEKVNGLMALYDQLEQAIGTHYTTQEEWMRSCLREVVQVESVEEPFLPMAAEHRERYGKE